MKQKITLDEFNRRIKMRFPQENFKVIKYEGYSKPAQIRCEQCNKIIQINEAHNFLAKNKRYGCVECHGYKNQREDFLEQIQQKYNIINTTVKDTHTYYTIKCKYCGHERTSTLKNLIKHLDCGCSTGTKRHRTGNEFIDEVNAKNIMQYELVSNYVNQTTKVLVKHKDCGFIFKAWPHDLTTPNKIHCPKCIKRISTGEHLIAHYLTKYNIPYEMQKQVGDTRQRFDFYININNQKFAIEYNGAQHYENIPYFHNSLKETQERDARKEKYCAENNIRLIVIPYTMKPNTIEEIIKNLFCEFND